MKWKALYSIVDEICCIMIIKRFSSIFMQIQVFDIKDSYENEKHVEPGSVEDESV